MPKEKLKKQKPARKTWDDKAGGEEYLNPPASSVRQLTDSLAGRSARKKFVPEDVAKGIADRYTILLKGTYAYIRFLNLNELEKSNHKNK